MWNIRCRGILRRRWILGYPSEFAGQPTSLNRAALLRAKRDKRVSKRKRGSVGRNAFCVSGNEEFFPLRKGAWGTPRGVFPKRFWKTKFYKNARFRRLDAGEIAREREYPQGIFQVTEQAKMRVQPRTSRFNGRGCTRAIFRVRCPKNRPAQHSPVPMRKPKSPPFLKL